MKKFTDYLKFTPIYEIAFSLIQKKQLRDWLKRGKKPPTPQLIKQLIVKQYASKYSIRTFIETGTYLGSMIDNVKNIFDKIYSIELDKLLYKRARKKFAGSNHISLYLGDSSQLLPTILKKIDEPTLFWLDAHYSDGITAKGNLTTPIMQEIRSILKHRQKKHIILIDDAILFIGKNNYPTIGKLKNIILKKYPRAMFRIKDNIIQIIPIP